MSRWGLTYKTFEVVWPDEWNAIVDALDELSKSIVMVIPACGSGLVFDYGTETSVMPFTGELNFEQPLMLPVGLKARFLAVHVYDNTLNADAYVYVRKNGATTDLWVKIGANSTGVFTAEVDGIDYPAGSGIDFLVDTKSATSGVLKIGSMVAIGFFSLPSG